MFSNEDDVVHLPANHIYRSVCEHHANLYLYEKSMLFRTKRVQLNQLFLMATSIVRLTARGAAFVMPSLSSTARRFPAAPFPAYSRTYFSRTNMVETDHQSEDSASFFYPGTPVMVEVTGFGSKGAGVDIIGSSHDEESIVDEDDPPLGQGILLQHEIEYFRQARDGLDVVAGEVLPAYIEKRNEETGYYALCLRQYGGKLKTESVGAQIMKRLESGQGVPVGDKSHPDAIAELFPGVSKGSFKKAVAALYKQRKARPGDHAVQLYDDEV